jgi:methylase of polypeptide subunit release factors
MKCELKFKFSQKVFKPTGTSDLLYKGVLKYYEKKKFKKSLKILDLGCGSGYVGIQVCKKLKNKCNFFSDISTDACKLTKYNIKKNNVKGLVKNGSLLTPWSGYKFDIIINDVSGISEKLSNITPWYNRNISNLSGNDGTNLTIKFLSQAKKYLEKKGLIFFPIISLSNYNKVFSFLKKNFKFFKKIDSKEWPLPKRMLKYRSLIDKLNKKKIITTKKKFGLIIFKTDIYIAKV